MQKAGEKARDIQFFSKKNNALVCVHSEEAKAFTRYLEEMDEVVSYKANIPWDNVRLELVSRVDIRKDYFQQQWTSDFCLVYADGSIGVREVIRSKQMEKRATVERLELSRRYWAGQHIRDWKIIVMEDG
jgi:hypothetical protein